MLKDYLDWPYLDHVFRRERQVTNHGKTTVEVRFGITSLPPSTACVAYTFDCLLARHRAI
jgi:hypothetical protein